MKRASNAIRPAVADGQSLLDPADWQAFRGEAHALLDTLITRLEHAADGPVWTPMPEAVQQRLAEPPPRLPQDVRKVCADLRELILPFGTGNTHPRFWGWVHGTGTAGGVLAEMAAAALNANCGGRDHGGIHVEKCVIDWMARWFGLPASAAGLLTTGSSMANLLGLAAARTSRHHRCAPARRRRRAPGRLRFERRPFVPGESLRVARAWWRSLAPGDRRPRVSHGR